MKYYYVNENKKKQIFKKFIKAKLQESGGFIKLSYLVEKIIIVLGVVLSSFVLLRMVLLSHNPIDLFYLSITGGFPYLWSLVFKTIYKNWILRGYLFRKHELIGVNSEWFEYSYNDSRLDSDKTLTVKFAYENIDKVVYDKKSGEISFYGKLSFKETKQDTVIDEDVWSGTAILNVFDLDILELLKQYKIDIKEK